MRLEPFGDLADRGRLAGAVHAREHDDEGSIGTDDQRLFQWPHQRGERRHEQCTSVGVVPGALPTGTKVGEDPLGGRDAHIRGDERGLELGERLLRERLATDQRCKRAGEARSRGFEPRAKSIAPGYARFAWATLEKVEHRDALRLNV